MDVPVVTAARMYFHLGTKDSQYSDFIELNTTAAWIGANTTRVDGFGLKLALRVHTKGGAESTVGEIQAVFAQGRGATFQEFVDAMPAPPVALPASASAAGRRGRSRPWSRRSPATCSPRPRATSARPCSARRSAPRGRPRSTPGCC
nr:hypothetical protein GCM10020063_044880 [Dactylosporangium thailandense]